MGKPKHLVRALLVYVLYAVNILQTRKGFIRAIVVLCYIFFYLSIRTQLTNHLPNSYKIVIKVKAKTNLMTSSFYLIIVTDT